MSVKMTKAEQAAMKQWTKATPSFVVGGKGAGPIVVTLKIGCQSFEIFPPLGDDDDWTAKQQAKWLRQMLGKALAKIAKPSLLKGK